MSIRLAIRPVAMFSLVGCALAVPATAFAHGGSHPTPWPSPSGGSGSGGSGSGGGGGAGGTRAGGGASGAGSWEKWWELNKWQYTVAARADVVLSGGGDAIPTADESSKAKTMLTEWLVAQCAHEYYDIRQSAALALGKSGDKSATEHLVKLLDDSNKEVQESAVLALGLMKDEKVLATIVEKILSVATQPSRLRAASAIALGFIGSKAATPELAKVYFDAKSDNEVKYGCLAGLGLLADESAGPHLIRVLFDKKLDEPLRAYAATALGKCGVTQFTMTEGGKENKINVPQYLGHILKGEQKERLLAQSAVQAIGALEALDQFETVYGVLDNHRDKPTQNYAALVLARLAKKGSDKHKAAARSRLEKLLDGRNHDARGFAALALGLLGEAPSAVPLRKSFENESDPSLKAACAIGLGLLKDEASVPAFQGKIMASSDTKLRGYCCIALGLIGHQNAVKDLERVVEISTVPELKAAAAIALAMMGNQRAMPVLLKSLSEASNYVRQSTIVALGYFRNTRAVKPIQDVFDAADTNKETKAICVVSLGYIIDRYDRPVFKQLAVDFNYLLPGEMTELVLRLF